MGVSIKAVFFLAAGFLLFPPGGQAALIDDFGVGDGPTLLTQSMLVAYDIDSATLSIRGFDIVFEDGSGEGLQTVFGGGVSVTLSVDGTGIASAGTFEVTGIIDSMGFDSGVLISGDISDFGWPDLEGRGGLDDILQFAINITGGDAAGLFGDTLAFLVTGADFPGDWTYDWANDGNAMGLAGQPIPIPATLWLMFTALLGLGFRPRGVRPD